MNKQERILRNKNICQLALSSPSTTLKQLTQQIDLSESQITLLLCRQGIKKEKGPKGVWTQTGTPYDPRPYIRSNNPKKRGRKYDPDAISKTAEYKIYSAMKSRCLNPNFPGYANWGGRGITICDRWLEEEGFKNFIEDMGRRPQGKTESGKRSFYTLERRNNNQRYLKENCYWASYIEQNNNQRDQSRGARITYDIACQIRSEFNQGINQTELAKKHTLSNAHISYIINNKIWKERTT